jgi:hypothetical protein
MGLDLYDWIGMDIIFHNPTPINGFGFICFIDMCSSFLYMFEFFMSSDERFLYVSTYRELLEYINSFIIKSSCMLELTIVCIFGTFDMMSDIENEQLYILMVLSDGSIGIVSSCLHPSHSSVDSFVNVDGILFRLIQYEQSKVNRLTHSLGIEVMLLHPLQFRSVIV